MISVLVFIEQNCPPPLRMSCPQLWQANCSTACIPR